MLDNPQENRKCKSTTCDNYGRIKFSYVPMALRKYYSCFLHIFILIKNYKILICCCFVMNILFSL